MSERSDIQCSIATTIRDYRLGEIVAPTPEYVDRWVRQFEPSVQIPLLRGIDGVLQRTYFSRERVTDFLNTLIGAQRLVGEKPCQFWRGVNFLKIQSGGNSQSEMLDLFDRRLGESCGFGVKQCGGSFVHVYLDDAIFTGNRVGQDLERWIKIDAQARSVVHIVVIATHQLGEWQCTERLRKAAATARKNIEFKIWSAIRLENRLRNRGASDVLWPSELPQNESLLAYVAKEKKFPFQSRQPAKNSASGIFTSESGRQLLERELLLAGMRIRTFSQNPSAALRPLGFSAFGLGFGSMLATFRNCPNNAPLALWWGDPDAAYGHPFRNWCPLLPRKTHSGIVDFDVHF